MSDFKYGFLYGCSSVILLIGIVFLFYTYPFLDAWCILVCTILILGYTIIFIWSLCDIDWKHKWKKWLCELPVLILISFCLTGLNPNCAEVISTYGFSYETLFTILVYGIFIMLMLFPFFNMRHS